MSFDHEDNIQIRNPWWCGGEVSQSVSKENEFWTYKWLNDFFSTIAGFVGILFPLLRGGKSMAPKEYEIMDVEARTPNKELD